MTSAINYTSIDATYPVAGVDNDSQGFRDNFLAIQTGLQVAASEITDLQNNVARTDDASTDFNNNTVTRANFLNSTETLYSGGILTGNTNIDYSEGSFQTFEINGNLQLTLTNFPSSNVARLIVQLQGSGTSRTVTFAVANGGTLYKESGVPGTITTTSLTTYKTFEFVTYNGGQKVFMRYLGTFAP